MCICHDCCSCGLPASTLPSSQPCIDDVAVKYGVDVFSDFVALVCSKDSSAKTYPRHQQQQQQPVSSLFLIVNTLSSFALDLRAFLHTGVVMFSTIVSDHYILCLCLQCFDAVGWAVGRASGL